MDITNNEIYAVYKPLGWTSFDVCNYIKKHYSIKKVGHCGTLDPLAAGVMVVATGSCTKQIPIIQKRNSKTYHASVCIGATTPTLDTEQFPHMFTDTRHITRDILLDQISRYFIGTIMQFPPLFSALKYEGVPLYEYARKAQTQQEWDTIFDITQRKIRTVDIFNITITQVNYITPDCIPHNGHMLCRNEFDRQEKFEAFQKEKRAILSQIDSSLQLCVFDCVIQCSTGVYIRSFARDIAQSLGYDGYLLSLERQEDYGYIRAHCVDITSCGVS